MSINITVTPDELQLVQHALSHLASKYKAEGDDLRKSGRPSDAIKASIKDQLYDNIWDLYVKTIQ